MSTNMPCLRAAWAGSFRRLGALFTVLSFLLPGLAAQSVGPTLTIQGLARAFVQEGQPVTLGVSASGTGAVSYQWFKGSQAISGATSSTYSIASAMPADDGVYDVAATDSTGTRRALMSVAVAPVRTELFQWSIWGPFPFSPPPASLASVAEGYLFTMALAGDGTVSAWTSGSGHGGGGTPAIPSGVENVVAIAAGYNVLMALKSDGSVVDWEVSGTIQTDVPAALSDVVAISAHDFHYLALKSDGTVVAWGSNTNGESTVPAGLSDVIGISAGESCSYALKADGSVVTWGTPAVATPAGLTNVVSIACGQDDEIAVKADGSVVTWGANSYVFPTAPTFGNKALACAASGPYAILLLTNGSVMAWDWADGGYSSEVNNYTPDSRDVFCVAASSSGVVALRDATASTMPKITSLSMTPGGEVEPLGTSVTFSVTATGTPSVTYQWLNNWMSPIAGQTGPTMTLPSIDSSNSGSYYVKVSNSAGSVTSSGFLLDVSVNLSFDVAPQSQTVNVGQPVTLTAHATGGDSHLYYSWEKDGRSIQGVTSGTLTIASATAADAGVYTVMAMDGSNSNDPSVQATLTVVDPPPSITTQPQSQSVYAGQPATFSVEASGNPPLTYQWSKDGSPISGATSSSLSIASASASDAGTYRVVVSNGGGSATSLGATLSVSSQPPSQVPPSITTEPSPESVHAGDDVTLSVAAASLTAATYQWFKDGVAIPGADSATLDLGKASASMAGKYSVAVTNASGTTTSSVASVAVAPVDHFLAVSTRCYVGTGEAIGVPAFILTQPGVVLIRASGPSLAQSGISGVLAKPMLTLYNGSQTAIASDQGWQNAPTYLNGTKVAANGDFGTQYDIAAIAKKVGAFTQTSPDDSAMAIQLPAGVYTVEVKGADGGSGNAIVEAYLYESSGDTATGNRFSAISTRCFVGTGDSNAVVGLSLAETTKVLLRGVGPSLAPYGVSGTLAKPTITLYDGSGKVMASNTGWEADSTQESLVAQAAKAVGDFPLTTADDSALLVTLPAGLYTAQVSGADGGTGIAIVEAYLVPAGN